MYSFWLLTFFSGSGFVTILIKCCYISVGMLVAWKDNVVSKTVLMDEWFMMNGYLKLNMTFAC
jgi:hypothetical protein